MVKCKHAFRDKMKVINSSFYRGICVWDQLPSVLQSMYDVNVFKNIVRSVIESGQMIKYR